MVNGGYETGEKYAVNSYEHSYDGDYAARGGSQALNSNGYNSNRGQGANTVAGNGSVIAHFEKAGDKHPQNGSGYERNSTTNPGMASGESKLCPRGSDAPARTMSSHGLLQFNQLLTVEGRPRSFLGPSPSRRDKTQVTSGRFMGDGRQPGRNRSVTPYGNDRTGRQRVSRQSAAQRSRSATTSGEIGSHAHQIGASGYAPEGDYEIPESLKHDPSGVNEHNVYMGKDYDEYTEEVEQDPAYLKYKAYSVPVKGLNTPGRHFGHFPHPIDPDKKGLPYVEKNDNKRGKADPRYGHEKALGLPSNYVKPIANTTPISYNYLRQQDCPNDDLFEERQREMTHFVERQHKYNKEVRRILDPSGNSYSKEYFMHATTKPLGRMYFDNKSRLPKFKLSDAHVKAIFGDMKGPAAMGAEAGSYERKRYDFWR